MRRSSQWVRSGIAYVPDPTTEMAAVDEREDGPRNAALNWALNILGDRWTLLVLSEISAGTRRFNELQRGTGMSRDRLSMRLRHLEARGLVCRRRYCDHPPRCEYGLTEAGRSLLPTLHALEAWGARYSVCRSPAGAAPSLDLPGCAHPDARARSKYENTTQS